MTALPQDGELTLPATVARRVRGLMAELRLSQLDVGLALGVSRSGVSDRLGGVKDFDLKELPVLSRILGEPIGYLLGITNERTFATPEAVDTTLTARYLAAVPDLVALEIEAEQPQRMADVLTFRRPRAPRRWTLGRSA